MTLAIGFNSVVSVVMLSYLLRRCYIVDDRATVIVSVDHANRDLDSVSFKVREPRAFSTLVRSGVFVRRQRTDGVERCLAEQHSLDVSHLQSAFYNFLFITSLTVGLRSIAMNTFVCLSVRSRISKTACPNFTKFSVRVIRGRSSSFSKDNGIDMYFRFCE